MIASHFLLKIVLNYYGTPKDAKLNCYMCMVSTAYIHDPIAGYSIGFNIVSL